MWLTLVSVGCRALRPEGAGEGGGAPDASHRHAARPLHVQLRCAEEAALLPAHPRHDPETAHAQQGGTAASQLLQGGARGRDGRAATAHHPDALPQQPPTLLGRAPVTWRRVTWSAKQWRSSPRRRCRRRRTITNCLESELGFLVRLLFVHICNNNYCYYHYTVLANLAFWLVCVCVLVYRIVSCRSVRGVVEHCCSMCIYVRQRTFISSIDRCYWCPLCSGWSFVTSHPRHGPCPSCNDSPSVASRFIDLRRCSHVAVLRCRPDVCRFTCCSTSGSP